MTSHLTTGELARMQFVESADLHQALLVNDLMIAELCGWAAEIAQVLTKGGIVFFAGNGGSFADAQHMAAEFTGKMGRMRRPLAAVALGTNSSSLSAIGNDFGWEYVFAREIEALHRDDSVLIAISTSGASSNVIRAAEVAITLGCTVLGFVGAKGHRFPAGARVIAVPSERTERIQEMHTFLLHTLVLLVEAELQAMGELNYVDP